MPRLPYFGEVHGDVNSIALLQYQLHPMQESHIHRRWVVRHRPMLTLERR